MADLHAAEIEALTALFDEAIELAGDAQAALIERVRSSDPALADELAALLASHAGADKAGARVVSAEALARTVDERRASRRPRPALSIPGYRMHDVIGEGGMGTVYAAEQIEPRRPVAIKVLFARSENALARFKAEAQIMAQLDHPSIARVLEAGDEAGQAYLVMEYVDGVTLDRFAGPLSREERLRLFLAICDAVHHAHVNGVIHRDLKPSNVMVRSDQRVVILDFGVARLVDNGSTPGDTRAGDLVGTPLYMSPEQAELRPDAVDARSDVYTLGVILYELVSGELPHDVRELPLPVVTRVICEDPTIPLGKRDPALRGDLEAIAGKALEKSPADRYQSVAALADDVRRLLNGSPVSVRVPGTAERARRFVKRRPLLATALAGAALATATFAAVVTGLWLDARSAREAAEHARTIAEDARADLEGRTNQLVVKQARAALERDPTEALAWLATLTARGVDTGAVSAVFDEAIARGVAHDVLRGHTDEVHWVEALPASEAFVTGGYDGRVVLWEPPAFVPRTLLEAKRGRVHVARPSPDGARIAVGGDDGEAYVIGRDGKVMAELIGHAGDVQHVAWSPDSTWLASGDDRGHLRVWSVAEQRELVASHTAVGAVAFAEDGSALIAGDHAGHVWLWSVPSWRASTAETGADVANVWTDGRHAAAVTVDGSVHHWHVAGGVLVEDGLVATHQNIKRATFAPRGGWAVLGGVGGTVTRIEGGTTSTLGRHRSQVRSLALSADGHWLADGGDDGVLVLRDLRDGRAIRLRGHRGRIRHLELTATTLLSSDSAGVVRRWDLKTLGPRLLQADDVVTRFATDGTRLAAIDEAGSVFLWSLAGGARTRLGTLTGRATALALVGGTVVTGTAEGEVTWWGATPTTVNVHGVIKAIATTHDRVAVASNAGPIHLFTAAGAPAGQLVGHTGGSDALAFDRSGDVLVSGGQDRRLRLWRRAGDTFVASATATGLRGDTHFVAFSAAGDRVFAAGNDGAVVAWNMRDGALAGSHVLARHTGAVTALAVDRGVVVSAGRDNRVIRVAVADGSTMTAVLASAATALAVAPGGAVHAVTRDGSVERVDGERATIEIDHGVRTGVVLGPDRWIVAHDDGALLILPLATRPLDQVTAAIAHATRFTLPAR